MNDNYNEVLIHGNDRFAGTGHISEIVTDNKNKTRLLYHAVDKLHRRGRVLMLDEVQWKDGWPFVDGNVPGSGRNKPSF